MTDFIAGVTKKRKVEVSEIQRSYIISELSKAVNDQNRRTSFIKKIVAFLYTLNANEIANLAGLLSNDYRKNWNNLQ